MDRHIMQYKRQSPPPSPAASAVVVVVAASFSFFLVIYHFCQCYHHWRYNDAIIYNTGGRNVGGCFFPMKGKWKWRRELWTYIYCRIMKVSFIGSKRRKKSSVVFWKKVGLDASKSRYCVTKCPIHLCWWVNLSPSLFLTNWTAS